jgi:glycosyltransferase involved in cell wall biosynthesis
MKLIYLSHWRFPSQKTTTPFTLRTCEEFQKLGYAVELWIPRRKNPDDTGQSLFDEYRISEQFRVRRLPAIDFTARLGKVGFLLMVASFNVSAFVALLFRSREGTVLYGQDMRDTILPGLLGLPLFVEIHDFYESSLTLVNRAVLKRATGLIVTNTLKIQRLHDAYGYPLERMLHQANAVDASVFDSPRTRASAREELGIDSRLTIVLYAGHLYSWKGVDTLLRAAAFLPEHIHVYFVGGTPEDRARLEEVARHESIQRVTFIGHVSQAKIPLYLRAADVLVLPNTATEEASRIETSPVKLFEYIASGTPIVAADLPSIREIVTDEHVLFAKPDTPQDFAEKIVATATGGAEVSARAREAKELARRHSWEGRAAAISAFIQKRVDA